MTIFAFFFCSISTYLTLCVLTLCAAWHTVHLSRILYLVRYLHTNLIRMDWTNVTDYFATICTFMHQIFYINWSNLLPRSIFFMLNFRQIPYFSFHFSFIIEKFHTYSIHLINYTVRYSAIGMTCRAPNAKICGAGSTLSEYELYFNYARAKYPGNSYTPFWFWDRFYLLVELCAQCACRVW